MERESAPVRHRMALLALLGLAVLVPFLGWHDLWYPDEPDVGQVARAMYESGDWIAPRRNDQIWVDYPPMVYWAASLASHAQGGMDEFSVRLPQALSAVALVLLTCAAVSRWLGPRAGLWSGFVLLSFQRLWYESQGLRPDLLFGLWIAAGMLLYYAGCVPRPRWGLRALGFVCLGLAMLAKGPLGLLLPGLVLTLWHASRREWKLLLGQAPLSLLALAVYLPWFVACARAMGADDILHELYAQNFARFLEGAKRGHEQPVSYYLVNVWPDLLPWSPLLPFALWWGARRAWGDALVRLAWIWFVAFFAFLTLAATKRQVYLLPAWPAAALLLGGYLVALFEAQGAERPDPRPARVVSGLLAVVYLALGAVLVVGSLAFDAVLPRLDLDELEREAVLGARWPAAALGVVLVAGGLWVGAARRRGELPRALARMGGVALAAFAVVSALVFPALEPVKSYRPAAEWLRAEVGDQPTFGFADPTYSVRKMGALTYYSGVLVEHVRSEEEIARYLAEHPDSVVVVNADAVDRLFTTPREDWPWEVVQELRASRFRYLVLR